MSRKALTIIHGPIDTGKASRPEYRTTHVEGKKARIRVIDAESPTFAADFLAGFRANVRKARAENRALSAMAAE